MAYRIGFPSARPVWYLRATKWERVAQLSTQMVICPAAGWPLRLVETLA